MSNKRSNKRSAVALCSSLAIVAMSQMAIADDASVDFFNRNGGGRSGDPFAACRLEKKTQTYNLKERAVRNCKNDTVRSMELLGNFPKGFKVILHDSPDGRNSDDWTIVVVKRDLVRARVLVGTFENDFENQDVKVSYHRKNGLDGKVSRIRTEMP